MGNTHDVIDNIDMVNSCLSDFEYFLCYSVTAFKILVLTEFLKWIIGFFPNEDYVS